MKLEIVLEGEETAQTRLQVRGDVNIHTANDLRKQLKPLFDQKRQEIHVDLSGVDFMDSAGIATLVEGLQWSQKSGGHFFLSGLSSTVHDIFSLAKLDTVFDIVEENNDT